MSPKHENPTKFGNVSVVLFLLRPSDVMASCSAIIWRSTPHEQPSAYGFLHAIEQSASFNPRPVESLTRLIKARVCSREAQRHLMLVRTYNAGTPALLTSLCPAKAGSGKFICVDQMVLIHSSSFINPVNEHLIIF